MGLYEEIMKKHKKENDQKLQTLMQEREKQISLPAITETKPAPFQLPTRTNNNPNNMEQVNQRLNNLKNYSKNKEIRDIVKESQEDSLDKKIINGIKGVYNDSYLRDGYQFGDLLKTSLSTKKNIATNALHGLGKAAENFYDFSLNASSNINTWLNEKLGIQTKEQAEKERQTAADIIKRDLTTDLENNIGFDEEAKRKWEQGSLVRRNNLGGKVAQGVGEMAPQLLIGNALGGTGAQWKALNFGKALVASSPTNLGIGITSYGGGLEEAYNEGATTSQANKFALGSALVEMGTEWITGGVPGVEQTGIIDHWTDEMIDKASNSMSKFLLKQGFTFLGEGGEEGLSEIIKPYLQNATYTSGRKVNWNDVFESFVVGGLVGDILELPGNLSNYHADVNALKEEFNNELARENTSNSINIPTVENISQNGLNVPTNANVNTNQNNNISLPTVENTNPLENLQEFNKRQQEIRNQQVQEETTRRINTLEEQLEQQGNRILEESESQREAMIESFKEYLEEHNITNPTQQDINDSITDIMSYDNDLDFADTARAEQLYNKYVKEYMQENGIPFNNGDSLKQSQLDIIKKSNPMQDDYHTGIRNVEDIKTLEETLNDSDYIDYDEFNPDLTRQDIENAIKSGMITVYSSYPIENGVFVSPSKMEAESYSGNGKIYSKQVPINDIAWIDPTQGQYAKVPTIPTVKDFKQDIKLPTIENNLNNNYNSIKGSDTDVSRTNKIDRTYSILQNQSDRQNGGYNNSNQEQTDSERNKYVYSPKSHDVGSRTVREVFGEKARTNVDSKGKKLTEDQNNFYANDMVRNADGNLLVVYHGTKEQFDAFDKSKIGSNTHNVGMFGCGFYFTENKALAGNYNFGENVPADYEPMALYVNITNPFYWNGIKTEEQMNEFVKKIGLEEDILTWNRYDQEIHTIKEEDKAREFSKKLQENGYDGIIYKYDHGQTTSEIVAFEPNQIKSVDNLHPTTESDNIYERTNNSSFSLPKNPTKESSYDDTKEYKKTRKTVQEELKQEMGITIDDIAEGKDISSLDFQRTDPIRLNEKVFGAKVGQKINDATINKTKHNEAERTRFLNKEREEISNLGIKPRSKESAAVQKYGEKQFVSDKGEVSKYGDAQLAAEFPDVATQNKIKHAAEVLRNKYDKYIDQINSVITELGYDPIPKRPDYMRHFQEINDKLSQWGIPLNPTDMSKDTLPTDINGITDQFKPGKNWFASAMQRKGFKTTYDAITGIDGYLEGASNLIYHTEDIQRYRALSKFIRDTYGQSHGMDNIDPSTEEGQKRLNDIFDNKLSKYAAWLDEQANALAGKKGGIDRAAERLLGRKVYTVLDSAKKQVGSNMTGFNVRSALTNFASAVQGAAKTKKISFIKGTMSTLKNIVHNDGMIDKSDFLTNRFGSDQLSKKFWQKASNAGQIFMTGSDYFTANQIWRSKYYEYLDSGMSESQAIKKADDFASRIMGDRSKGSTAEIFNSKTLGLLTQFQLEVNNQWSSIIHDNKMDIKTGNKSGATVMFQLGQLAAMSFFFNNFMKSLTGSDVMIDPIDMLKKMIGSGDDDEEKSLEERTQEVLGDLWNDLPFASFMTGGRIPMKEAFKGGETLLNYATGQKNSYGQKYSVDDVKKDLTESAFYWLLPTGYGQVKKTTKGLKMYDSNLPMPGSYTDSGNLRFRADESTGGKIKAALFGQYSSKESQKYMDSGYKAISKSRLDEVKELDMSASNYRKYREALNQAGTTNADKIEFIANSDYTNREKNIMAKNVLGRNFDIDEYEKYDSYEEYDYATKYPDKYSVIKYIAPYDKYTTYKNKITDIRNNTTNDKAETIKYINSLSMSIPQKAMFIKQYYKNFTNYDKDIIKYINNQKLTVKEKEQILTQLGFTVRNGRVY